MININASHIAKLETERIMNQVKSGSGNKRLRELFLALELDDDDMKELVDGIAYSVACSIVLMLDEKSPPRSVIQQCMDNHTELTADRYF